MQSRGEYVGPCNFLAKNDLEAVVVHSGGQTIEEIAIALSVVAHSSGK